MSVVLRGAKKLQVNAAFGNHLTAAAVANSPPCACCGSSGQKPQHVLMMMAYQRFTAVFLLIYGSLFLSGAIIVSVFWCAVARMSELELEQRTNTKFLVNLGKS
jgi:hypothetical protein